MTPGHRFYFNSVLAVCSLAAGLGHSIFGVVLVIIGLILWMTVLLFSNESSELSDLSIFRRWGRQKGQRGKSSVMLRRSGLKLRPQFRLILWPLAVTIVAGLYGYWTEQMNRSNIPHTLDGHQVFIHGTITSAVQVDGDRASFQSRIHRLSAENDVSEHFSESFRDMHSEDLPEKPSEELSKNLPEKPSGELSKNLPDKLELYPDERVQVTIYLDSLSEQQTVSRWRRGMEIRFVGHLQRPGVARNFGDFDYRDYLHTQRIHWQVTVQGLGSAETDRLASAGMAVWTGYIDQFRDRLSALVWSIYDERYAGFMQGLLIGDRQEIPQNLYEQFSDIGMTHVLAISGLHVGVFTAGCFWLTRLFRLTRERGTTICFILIPLYVVLTGASPSAIRAGVMAMLGLIAMRAGRWKDSLRFIVIAALLMLAFQPYYLYNVSFQLSFVVTLGLILFVPPMVRWLNRMPTVLAGALSVTIVAQLCSFPLVIYYFHTVHILSPVANLLLVPLVSLLILPVGMLSLIVGSVFPTAAQWLATSLSLVTESLFRAVEWTANMDALLLTWPKMPLWWMILYYLLLYGLFQGMPVFRMPVFVKSMNRKNILSTDSRPFLFVIGCAMMIASLMYAYAGDHWDRTGMVSVLDVGQGDAILIRSPHGRTILVDGGGTIRFGQNEAWRQRRDPYEVGKDTVVPLLRRRGIHRLDAVIATHLDADHIGGLHAVLERIPTQRLLYNGTMKDSGYAERLADAAKRRGVPMIAVAGCMTWQLDPHTVLTFVHPIPGDMNIPSTGSPVHGNGQMLVNDQNGVSVVFILEMYENRFLLTGDIGSAEERKILDLLQSEDSCFHDDPNDGHDIEVNRSDVDRSDIVRSDMVSSEVDHVEVNNKERMNSVAMKIDMLKVAHHGSRYSTSPEWLDYWQTATAAISVGRNNYGHPSGEVIDRLETKGITVYRTDHYGEIQYAVRKDKPLYIRVKWPAQRPN